MSTVTQPVSVTGKAGVPLVQRLFRRLALDRLNAIRRGRLVVRDEAGMVEYGDAEAPPVEIVVQDMSLYRDLCLHGSLGAAAGYMDGKWHCRDLTGVFRLFINNMDDADGLDHGLARLFARIETLRHWWRRNTPAGSRRNIREHYDLGNDLFELFLDETMTYSAAVYPGEESNLAEASLNKLDRICRKLDLGPGDHVLEIGTGWGSFAMHAAGRYGCRVTTATISQEQYELAGRRIQQAGLSDRITLLKEDYRNLTGRYDKLVSIEMIEAVGHEYLGTYFEKCSSLLKEDGLMLIQVISLPEQRYAQYLKNSDFIQRYIFPGSCCPALGAMLQASRLSTDMKLVHLEDIAAHYERTLRDWRNNFDRREAEVRALGYDDRFIRMWRYYLSYCEAGFGERYLSDYQLVFAKPANRALEIRHAA